MFQFYLGSVGGSSEDFSWAHETVSVPFPQIFLSLKRLYVFSRYDWFPRSVGMPRRSSVPGNPVAFPLSAARDCVEELKGESRDQMLLVHVESRGF